MIVITMGDPRGIGPAVVLKSLAERENHDGFVVIGDRAILERERKALGLSLAWSEIFTDESSRLLSKPQPGTVGLCHVPGYHGSSGVVMGPNLGQDLGKALGNALGNALVKSIDIALNACLNGQAQGMVTGPLSKHDVARSIPTFRGHTGYLGRCCARETVMMMKAPALATVPLTEHIPLVDIPRNLSIEFICHRVQIVHDFLRTYFGIARPRLALAGINPHAGECGLVGNEEQTILQPAVKLIREQGIDLSEPMAADTLFIPARRSAYDCILCPGHDQALIPMKALYFDSCVNVTLGLPFVRTSPDHGPAYDAKSLGSYQHQSMAHAIQLASDLSSS